MIHSESEIEVLAIVPKMDVFFFKDKNFLQEFFKKDFSDIEWEFYQRDPKWAYHKLQNGTSMNEVRKEMIKNLKDENIEVIRKDEKIQKIVEFFN